MNNKLTPYVRRPTHIVRCAIPGCNKLGFREDACWSCGEYRCPKHADSPVQGNEVNAENFSCLIDPKKPNERRCFPCGNTPRRLVSCNLSEFEREFRIKVEGLEAAIKKTEIRKQFGLLLAERFQRLIEQLDLLESSPLEQTLWAELFARYLDRYFQPQVELYDNDGKYIVRVDFASTLLRIALFCDGRTYHSSPADVARDNEHNRRLESLGWTVRRYWTEDINSRHEEIADEIYHLVCERIAHMPNHCT